MLQNPRKSQYRTNVAIQQGGQKASEAAGNDAIRSAIYNMKYSPPERVWSQGDNGLWSSREWRAGEKAEYSLNVLGRTL